MHRIRAVSCKIWAVDECCWSCFHKWYMTLDVIVFSNSFSTERIMNVRSHCVEHYLLSDINITHYLKLHRSTTQWCFDWFTASNFVHAKTSWRPLCGNVRRRAGNLSSHGTYGKKKFMLMCSKWITFIAIFRYS